MAARSDVPSPISHSQCLLFVNQVKLYRQMGQPAHCVQMKAVFNLEGECRTSAILHPRCEVLGSAPDLQTLRRLGSDVAAAIQELYQVRGVLWYWVQYQAHIQTLVGYGLQVLALSS